MRIYNGIQQDIFTALRVTLGIKGLSDGIRGQLFGVAIQETDLIDTSVHGRLPVHDTNRVTASFTFPTEDPGQLVQIPSREEHFGVDEVILGCFGSRELVVQLGEQGPISSSHGSQFVGSGTRLRTLGPRSLTVVLWPNGW